MIKKIIYVLILVSFSQHSFSVSKQYPGGDVYIKLINENPCFYIKNNTLTGHYYVTLFEDKTIKKLGSYSSEFQSNYPNESQCISTLSLNNIHYQKDMAYLIVLETEDGFGFGKSFCIGEKDGTKIIQKFTGQCEDKVPSLWERFLKILKFD